MSARLSILFVVSALTFSCSSAHEPVKLPPAGATSPDSSAAAAKTKPAEPAPAPAAKGKVLTFTAPEGWVTETPSGGPRIHQYKLAKQGTDTEDALVAITYFGTSSAGPLDANLDRWAGQFTQPDGRDSKQVMQHTTRTVAGLTVHEVDVSGTFDAAMPSAGAAPTALKANFRLLGAIIQSDHGDYYVKLTGPQDTVKHWAASMRQFISDVKPGM